jgi:hypothetical protein
MPKVNIHKIKKPNIVPPVTLSELDDGGFMSFEVLGEKYEREMYSMFDAFEWKGEKAVWMTVRRSIIDAIFLNFQTISHYMNDMIYNNISGGKNGFEDGIRTAVTASTFGSWCVGKEFIKNKPSIATKFLNKDTIDINDIPFEETQMLIKAVYLSYCVFADLFSDYYDSEYGKRVKYQKEGHFTDTYQSMMKGILACFLEGIQS